MADNTRGASSSRIAFTLPISCQICLGKVKQPVVCPNQHAFCSPCMDIWLQRNQQCPSCRVEITSDNPCKQILGGLSHHEEEANDFAKNKELRRSRLELLCKDYEDEIERLEMENEALDHEKKILEEQVKSLNRHRQKDGNEGEDMKASTSASSTSTGPDVNMLMMLTKKLHDATGLYEKVKKDMDKLKQENSNVKDESATLNRENQRLRMELVGRSPRKFGRFTVATLESKLEQKQKEVKQLQKALERSDAYIEDVEKELEGYRKKLRQQNLCVRCKVTLNDADEKEFGTKTTESKKDHENLESDKMHLTVFELGKITENELRSNTGKCDGNTGKNKPGQTSGPEVTSGDAAEWKKLPINFNEEKKSMSISNFYGKKPLVEKKVSEAAEVSSSRGKCRRSPRKTSPHKLCDTSSFELEMPSMCSPSVSDSLSRMGKMDITDDSIMERASIQNLGQNKPPDKGNSTAISPVGSAKKKLKFETSDVSDVSGLSFLNSPDKGKGNGKRTCNANKQVTFNRNVSVKNMLRSKNALNDSLLDVTLPSETSEIDVLNDLKSNVSNLGDETFDINNSMNSDIMDCMELFDSAERRLGQKKNDPEPAPALNPVASSSRELGQELPSSSTDFSKSLPSGDSRISSGFRPESRPTSQPQTMPPAKSGSDFMPAFIGSVHAPATSSDQLGTLGATWPAPHSHVPLTSSSQYISSGGFPGQNPAFSNHSLPSSTETSNSRVGSTRNELFRTECTSNFSSGGLGSFAAAGGLSVSSLPNSSVEDHQHGSMPIPSRPASTSTLHNMLQRLNSIDAEHTRPSSAPGLSPLPGSTSNLMSDFRPSNLLSAAPSSSHSVQSGFDPSMFGSNHPRFPGSTMNRGHSGSYPNIPGSSSVPGLPGGFPPSMGMRPGCSSLLSHQGAKCKGDTGVRLLWSSVLVRRSSGAVVFIHS